MGWQDAPLVDDTQTGGMQPSYLSAPEVGQPQAATPDPSMGQVMLNAVPKAAANLLNTPITLANLIMMGIANLPMAGHLQGVQAAAATPALKENVPMEAFEKIGLVDPNKNPVTGPQRIVDMAIQAAIGGAIVPGAGLAGAAKGAVVGAASGAAAQTVKEVSQPVLGETGSTLLAVAVGAATPFAAKAFTDSAKKILLNPTEKLTLKDAQQYGFVVEPSRVRKPSDIRESVAGQGSIAQEAAIKNQAVANTLADKAIGLPDGTPISRPLLKELRERAGKAYDDLAKLSPDAATAVEEVKQVRADAQAAWRSYQDTANPSMLTEYKRLSTSADGWETVLEDIAQGAGQPELIARYHAARTYIARTYDIQNALNVGSGNISLPKLGKMLSEGVPLSGELEVMGKFALAFKRVAREIEGIPPSGVSATNVMVGEGLATAAAAGSGSPAGLLAGGLPGLRNPAREKVLSQSYQQGLLTEPAPPTPPSVTAGRAASIGALIGDNQE